MACAKKSYGIFYTRQTSRRKYHIKVCSLTHYRLRVTFFQARDEKVITKALGKSRLKRELLDKGLTFFLAKWTQRDSIRTLTSPPCLSLYLIFFLLRFLGGDCRPGSALLLTAREHAQRGCSWESYSNTDLIKMAKEIIVSMNNSQDKVYVDSNSATDNTEAIEIIYNKLVELKKKNKDVNPY